MRLAEKRRRTRVGARRRGRSLPHALIAAGLLLTSAAPAAAQRPTDAQPITGALVAWGDLDQEEPKLRRLAVSRLQITGAGQFDADQITPWTELIGADGGWFSPVPLETCAAASRSAEALAGDLEQASVDLQFGRLDRARDRLGSAERGLPCLDGFVDAATLHSLWFLAGALEYLEGREAEARLFLVRAAQADSAARFDDSFPPALHDIAVQAKEEALQARVGRASFVLADGEVRVDGRPIALVEGGASAQVGPGVHLVQVRRGDVVQTRVLRTEGVPYAAEQDLLVVAGRDALHAALEALFEPPARRGPAGERGARFLQVWLAAQGLPWLLVVDASPGGGELRVVEARGLADEVIPYEGRPKRGDDFTRRVRLAAYAGLRAQQAGLGVNDPGRAYVQWSVGLWIPVHWWLRTGVALSFAHTNNPQPVDAAEPNGETVACCTLPELSFRLRGEWPTGRLRPYLEGALLLGWPYSLDPEHPETTGMSHAVWGVETGVGVLLTPGQERRIGINLGVHLGAATEIRGWLKGIVGIEVRL